jgi:hypothetical protein
LTGLRDQLPATWLCLFGKQRAVKLAGQDKPDSYANVNSQADGEVANNLNQSTSAFQRKRRQAN